jgi:uncharacterized coiled-coil protein SlyX
VLNQIELESKIAFQEMALEKLQKTVDEQQALLEKVNKSLALLKERFEAASRGDGAVGAANQKPPHY